MGTVQLAIIKTVHATLDFIYYAQFTSHTSETLASLEAAFYEFHDNKDIFVCLGQCDHFNIPKLHSMLHYLASINPVAQLMVTTQSHLNAYTLTMPKMHIAQ